MKKVLEQYMDHAQHILNKVAATQVFAAKQRKGYAYYRAAIQTLEALIDAPKPAWYDFKFKASRRA
jgi:uncharacterized protein YutE (UPF0331/DUF86 family)